MIAQTATVVCRILGRLRLRGDLSRDEGCLEEGIGAIIGRKFVFCVCVWCSLYLYKRFAVGADDFLAEKLNVPKTRAIAMFSHYGFHFLNHSKFYDGTRTEAPHQIAKRSLTRHLNHCGNEVSFMHDKWIDRLVWRYLLKGMRWGPDLSLQLGSAFQNVRERKEEGMLNKLIHSQILLPHGGMVIHSYHETMSVCAMNHR